MPTYITPLMLDDDISYSKEVMSHREDLIYITNERLKESGKGILTKYVPNVLKTIYKGIDGFFSYSTPIHNTTSKLINKQDKYTKILYSADYGVVGILTVPIPVGFKGDMLRYGNELHDISEVVYKSVFNHLNEYSELLARLISNKAAREHFTNYEMYYKEINKEQEDYSNRLSKFYSTNRKDRLPLRAIVSDLKEFTDVFTILRKIRRTESTISLPDVHHAMNRVIDNLTEVLDGVKSGDYEFISKEVASRIANGAYGMARYIELLSSVNFSITNYVAMVEHILNKTIQEKK